MSDLRKIHESYLREHHIPAETVREFLRRIVFVHKAQEQRSTEQKNEQLLFLDDTDLINYLTISQISTERVNGSTIALAKLNGGIATSMSLPHAKSYILLKNNKSFLDLILDQLICYKKTLDSQVPIIFMNSPALTQIFQFPPSPSLANCGWQQHPKIPLTITQNLMPRIISNNWLPLTTGTSQDWYPGGHGEILHLLHSSNILNNLLDLNYQYIFISNSDNVNATIDPVILNFILEKKIDFLAEITQRTINDKKGGIFVKGKNGSLRLLEFSQTSLQQQRNIEKNNHFFNINNIWIHLEGLRDLIKKKGELELDIIVNQKTICGQSILQLETSIGSAVRYFPNAKLLKVPRRRFTPVKTFNDLLIKKSDCYKLNIPTGTLEAQTVSGREPVVDLDERLQKLTAFHQAFPVIPSLKNCRSLKINGSFIFDQPVELVGDVVLSAPNKVKNRHIAPIRMSKLKQSIFEDNEFQFQGGL